MGQADAILAREHRRKDASRYRRERRNLGVFPKELQILKDERDFDSWMAAMNPPQEIVEEIMRKLTESISTDATGLSIHRDDEKLIMRRRSAVITTSRA